MFSMQCVSQNPLIAKIKLSSAASLNMGRSQNGVLGTANRIQHTWLTLIDFERLENIIRKATTALLPVPFDSWKSCCKLEVSKHVYPRIYDFPYILPQIKPTLKGPKTMAFSKYFSDYNTSSQCIN